MWLRSGTEALGEFHWGVGGARALFLRGWITYSVVIRWL